MLVLSLVYSGTLLNVSARLNFGTSLSRENGNMTEGPRSVQLTSIFMSIEEDVEG